MKLWKLEASAELGVAYGCIKWLQDSQERDERFSLGVDIDGYIWITKHGWWISETDPRWHQSFMNTEVEWMS